MPYLVHKLHDNTKKWTPLFLSRYARGFLREIRSETSMSFFGSEEPITGLDLLICARTPGGYGFNEFEMSSSAISAVFRQPYMTTQKLALTPTEIDF